MYHSVSFYVVMLIITFVLLLFLWSWLDAWKSYRFGRRIDKVIDSWADGQFLYISSQTEYYPEDPEESTLMNHPVFRNGRDND